MRFQASRLPTLSRSQVMALGVASAIGLANPVTAHDFWVQPVAYWARPEVPTVFTLQVGHGPFRLRSPIPARRIVRLEAIGPDGRRLDQRGRLQLGLAQKDGDFVIPTPGTYVLALQTDDAAQSHLPAIRYNDYLKVEGLTAALALRLKQRQTDMDGSENYSRCAKVIIQVGRVANGSQAAVTRPVGLPLEIVPEQSPYAEPRSATLPVRVLYFGRPLAGALVKLTDLQNDANPLDTRRTDASGRAIFGMPKRGTWLLNVIWTRAQPPSAETDFETTFSSLTFGWARD